MDDYGFQQHVVRPADSEGVDAPFSALAIGPNGLFFDSLCFRPVETDTFTGNATTATYTSKRYGSDSQSGVGHLPPCGYRPSELQQAYNLKPLYDAGLNGTGETIVITDAFGSTTLQQDVQVFAQIYGLPPVDLEIVKAPGLSNNPKGVARGWDLETTLDVEWAHAIAPGAKIVLVLATDRASLDEAINYAVVHHLGNTISNSWGGLEGLGNPAHFS